VPGDARIVRRVLWIAVPEVILYDLYVREKHPRTQ
jgi:hypothetical protein